MKKVILIIIIILLITTAVYFLFRGGKAEVEIANPLERTDKVGRGDLIVTVSAVGTVEPKQAVDVKSKASGQIISILIDEGDYLHTGDLICTLDKTTAYNDYRQAEADLRVAQVTLQQAKKELERQDQLFRGRLIAESQYDEALLQNELAQSQLIRAEATLALAKEKLDDTVIKSPLNGIVLKRYVDEGQIISSGISNVSGGTSSVMIAVMDTVYVEVAVDETDIGQVEIGQKCKIEADAYSGKKFMGKVMKISPMGEVDQNVTYFKVTTTVDNIEGLLKAGMNATCDITCAEAYDVLLVPREAVAEGLSDNDNPEKKRSKLVVYVKRDGEFAPVPVQTGVSNYEYTEIKAGLLEGDEIIVKAKSMVMADREEFRERLKRFNQLPGVKRGD